MVAGAMDAAGTMEIDTSHGNDDADYFINSKEQKNSSFFEGANGRPSMPKNGRLSKASVASSEDGRTSEGFETIEKKGIGTQ